MKGRLQDRRIVVTGASRGIGQAIASKFLLEGALVVGVAKDPARLDAAASALGPHRTRFWPVRADLCDPRAGARVAKEVQKRFGALDILVNNAGVRLSCEGFEKEAPDVLERTLALNLIAPHRLTRALLPLLRAGHEPRIIHVTSGAGMPRAMRERGLASYRLSKWALNGYTLLAAADLPGIAVNALDPGWVKTDMGGPEAPGTVADSAFAALALATAPFDQTGRVWCQGSEVPF